MPDSSPWDFGWNQAPTVAGSATTTTTTIAVAGFPTFGKWRREKIEERRIGTAIEALALCYASVREPD